MSFLITFSALENAIGKSAEGGNSVACFSALSAKSLPGIFECLGIYWKTMCVCMEFGSIWTSSTQAFRPIRTSYTDLLSVQISRILPMVVYHPL